MEKMKQRVIQFIRERGWEKFETPKDVSISLSLEAAELLEHFQWKNELEMKEHLAKNKKEISYEMADILYWLLVMSHYFDIDLEKTFADKMEQNEAKYPADKVHGKHLKYTAYQNE